jgi:hypothetical protein
LLGAGQSPAATQATHFPVELQTLPPSVQTVDCARFATVQTPLEQITSVHPPAAG